MTNIDPTDPVALTQALVQCPSITPEEGGALDLLERVLTPLGFTCERMPFDDAQSPRVDNLYAQSGETQPAFCFAGHTDVVPVGREEDWPAPPFAGTIRDGTLIGRGVVDMKGGVAAFIAAYARRHAKGTRASLALLITGDEEGLSINGTRKMLRVLSKRGVKLGPCLIGEPTCRAQLGDTIKIGRRGSLNGFVDVEGKAGHAAYPDLAHNPITALMRMLAHLTKEKLDDGNDLFPPSHLEVTGFDVGNSAPNVIPHRASAMLNVRFNDTWTAKTLEAWLRARLDESAAAQKVAYTLRTESNAESFRSQPGALAAALSKAVEAHTGIAPDLMTNGGTSDARFIKDYTEVAEFGLLSGAAHTTGESATLKEIETLCRIYEDVLAACVARI